MKKKFYHRFLFTLTCALVLVIVMGSSAVFAGDDTDSYPKETTNKDDVITIDKSAAWDGNSAQDADYEATVTLNATGIQTVVDYLPATNPVDISFVLDESGSMAVCNNSNHGNYKLFDASTLSDESETAALAAIKSYDASDDQTKWIVKVDSLSNSSNSIYLTPIKTTATTASLDGWAVFSVAADGSEGTWAEGIRNATLPLSNPSAPYYVSHFKLTDGVPTQHIVYAHGTDYYLSEAVTVGAGWMTSWADDLQPSVSFRSTADLDNAVTKYKCRYLYGTARDSATKFLSNIIDTYNDGNLAASSTLSVIPFAGVVDTGDETTQTVLSASGLETSAISKIEDAYEALGYYTNWGNTMKEAVEQLNSTGTSRQKLILFFTDGVPDMGDDDETAENLATALTQAKSLYNATENNRMYGVFLNRSNSSIETMNRMINATNNNNSTDTSTTAYNIVVNPSASSDTVAAKLEAAYKDILTYVQKWSKSTEIISITDTISKYYTIDTSKLSGTEGTDWKITTTDDGLQKITFYTSIDGFTSIDKIENEVPLVLKEAYRDTTGYYPTNDGAAYCTYEDINGDDTLVKTSTPYLYIENDPTVTKNILTIDDTSATDGDAVTVGDVIAYQINYENNTTATATVKITDALPAGTEFVSADNDGSLSDGTVTWTLADVAAGVSGSVTLKVKVTSSAEKQVDNTATVTLNSKSHDTNTVTDPLVKKTLVSINGDDTAEEGDIVSVGDEITYSIDYDNTTNKAMDVTITDALPAGTEFVSTDNSGTLKDGTVTWTLSGVAANTSGSVALTVKVTQDAVTKVVNVASVKLGDQAAKKTNEITNPLPSATKNILSINGDAAVNGDAVTVGDVIEYQINYENSGSKKKTITITDTIPTGTEFVSADNDGTHTDSTVTWTLADVAAGTSGSVTLKVAVTKDAVKQVDNFATVKIGSNSYTTNTVTDPVVKKSLVSVNGDDKATKETTVKSGDTIIYSIDYANTTDSAMDVTITDALPAGTEFVSADNGGTLKDGTVTWTLAGVAANTRGSVTITVKVTDAAADQIENVASVKLGDQAAKETNKVTNPMPDDVQTGDDFNIMLWAGIGLLAVLAGIAAVVSNKKKRHSFDDFSKKER